MYVNEGCDIPGKVQASMNFKQHITLLATRLNLELVPGILQKCDKIQ